MTGLPYAVPQNPACGACGVEIVHYGADDFQCENCDLSFDPDNDFSASFLDTSAEPCGFACDNFWHGDHKITQGHGYDCGTCKLPAGHTSLHWTGCEPKRI